VLSLTEHHLVCRHCTIKAGLKPAKFCAYLSLIRWQEWQAKYHMCSIEETLGCVGCGSIDSQADMIWLKGLEINE
jgi:hypothetical protein